MMTKRIGIIRRNGLGDLLCVMPLVLLCKERYPGCHITLFVDERGAPLTPYLPVDGVVVMVASSNKYLSLVGTLWKERRRKFDLLISAKPSPMKLVNLFLYFLSAKERIAYVDDAWHSKLINAPRVYFPGEERHQMVKSLRLLDPTLESVPTHLIPRLNVEPGYVFSEPTLFISVSNHRLGSALDIDKMQRLINRLTKRFRVIINCIPRDVKRAELLAEGLKIPSQVIATETFDQLMSLLASVDGCFIGDGGIMHLAAALNKPQVVLFGGTKIWEWEPLSDQAICLSDPHNVNFISEEKIQEALEKL